MELPPGYIQKCLMLAIVGTISGITYLGINGQIMPFLNRPSFHDGIFVLIRWILLLTLIWAIYLGLPGHKSIIYILCEDLWIETLTAVIAILALRRLRSPGVPIIARRK